MDIQTAVNILGVDFVKNLALEFYSAKKKHPQFPTSGKHPMTIIVEELGEACQAYNDGDYEHAVQEAHHTIVTLKRWIETLEVEHANAKGEGRCNEGGKIPDILPQMQEKTRMANKH